MKVLFRVNASREIGTGHLSRCSVLAKEAKRLSVASVFITNKLESHQVTRLKSDGNEIFEVASDPGGDIDNRTNPDWDSTGYARSETDDAERILECMSSISPDIIILDSYQLGQGWIDRVRSQITARILVIDDLRRPLTDVDLLVDQNLGAELRKDMPQARRLLFGPRYAILDRQYRIARERLLSSRPVRDRIVISVGGSDVTNLTLKYLRIVKAVLGLDAAIDVVIGPNQSLSDDLISETKGMKALRIWHNLECLADLFSRASLALGAGGTSSWERACLGVPSLISSVAQNQRQNCVSLSEVGAAIDLGDSLALGIDAGCATLSKLFENPERLTAMEHRSKLLVDGLGCRRVMKVLMQSEDDLNLREVTERDVDLLFSWRNELEVQRNSFKSQEVSWEEHERWFHGFVRNRNSPLYILEADDLPVGQLRIQVEDNIGTLTYSVDQDFRGRGYGKYMIMRAKSISNRLSLVQLLATVRSSNKASRQVFEQCGFALCSEDGEFLTYQFRLRQ